jgi:DNA replication and repair protein RecF
VLSDYDKALRQRNGLLKASRGRFGPDPASLDAWDERLVAAGAEWLDARDLLVADLEPLVAEQYRIVAGADQQVGLRTVRGIDPEEGGSAEGSTGERFLAALQSARQREIERGVTLVGPHRDDLLLTVNGLPARGYASHGESWSLALALRLAAVELLRGTLPTGDPIVILDDVFAELDEARRNRLADRVGRYEQVLITAAVEGDIPEPLHRHVTRIQAGTVLA